MNYELSAISLQERRRQTRRCAVATRVLAYHGGLVRNGLLLV